MPVVTIEDLSQHVGATVELRGWVHNRTSKGKLHFVILRDGTGFVQCVLKKNVVGDELFEEIGRASQESSLTLQGEVRADDRAPGGFEISVVGGEVLQSASEYPISPKEHGADFLLSRRHLWLRSKRQWAIIRIRSAVEFALRRFFDERGFLCVDSPIFTPSACEGTSTLFEVDYFGDEKAYLTQSGQLYAEATAMAFGKVYTFGPTFRAEKSKTRRHLTEFWMLEPEMAYATLEDVIQLSEDMVVAVVKEVLERRRTELETLERDISKLEALHGRLPQDHVRRRVEDPARAPRLRVCGGRRLRRARRDPARGHARSAAGDHPLPQGRQGLLHEGGAGRSHARPRHGRHRARGRG